MEKNWDPAVRKFFIKILNSISLGLIWILTGAIAGIYYELGFTSGKPLLTTIVFYAFMLITLVLLIFYLIKLWKNS